MRYSMMIYIIKMSRTLQEAAQYLRTDPEEGLAKDLLGNGFQMLAKIREVLTDYQDDLRSRLPLERLSAVEECWKIQNEKLETEIEALILCLPEEISYQVRAVFFTGLGSTWDAMESVYTYMRDDPRFDPVVVLIPVFHQASQDKQNGQISQIMQEVIYEDYLTPLGIPFYPYDKYSLEEDCPDLAFTCQPYNGAVLESFCPETIANHTRLVYPPYFLSDVVENTSITALCQLSVYRYAWKVVLPHQKGYRFYCRHSANHGANGLLTGIPKLDHLVLLRERGVDLPWAWERLRGKKVFLWNTWYDVIMSSFQHFEQIAAWFEEHTECALIWRPHPLTDTVIRPRFPELYAFYLKCIQKAQSMPNVVLDKGVSYDAAFFFSDAMISDYSSMLPQYLLMDKPALWIESQGFKFSGEEFIQSKWMERAKSFSDIVGFFNRVIENIDINSELRRKIRASDLPLADGCAGERLCEELWSALHAEDI